MDMERMLRILKHGLAKALEASDDEVVARRGSQAAHQIGKARDVEGAVQAFTWAHNGLNRVMFGDALVHVAEASYTFDEWS